MSGADAATLAEQQKVLSALGRHWNPTAAIMLGAAHRAVEGHASGTRVFAEDGSSSLDVAGSYGVFLVGHGNDAVRDAVLRTLAEAPTLTPGTVHPATARLCELLTEILPPGLNRYVLGCSGADVSETALRAVHLARPDRRKIVVAQGSYHGKTLGALSVLGQRNHREPFEPLGGDLVVVPYGDAAAVRAAVADRSVAAVFLEPVLGGAHLTVPPAGYVGAVAEACRNTDTLFVADEIQTGFGRTGWMLAVERDGAQPDIMLLSKAMTGGFVPIAVCALSERVLDDASRHPHWDPSLLSTTSCASALAVTAAVATIEEVRRLDLPRRAATVGPQLTEGLAEAARRHPKHIVGAPGIGLMTGLRTRNPAVELLVSMGMAGHGIHTGHSLNEQIDHPVLRYYPPLTVTPEEIGELLDATEKVLTDLDKRPRLAMSAMTALLRRQYKLPPKVVLKLSNSPVTVDW